MRHYIFPEGRDFLQVHSHEAEDIHEAASVLRLSASADQYLIAEQIVDGELVGIVDWKSQFAEHGWDCLVVFDASANLSLARDRREKEIKYREEEIRVGMFAYIAKQLVDAGMTIEEIDAMSSDDFSINATNIVYQKYIQPLSKDLTLKIEFTSFDIEDGINILITDIDTIDGKSINMVFANKELILLEHDYNISYPESAQRLNTLLVNNDHMPEASSLVVNLVLGNISAQEFSDTARECIGDKISTTELDAVLSDLIAFAENYQQGVTLSHQIGVPESDIQEYNDVLRTIGLVYNLRTQNE